MDIRVPLGSVELVKERLEAHGLVYAVIIDDLQVGGAPAGLDSPRCPVSRR